MKKKKDYKFTMLQVVWAIGLIPLFVCTFLIVLISALKLRSIMYEDALLKLGAVSSATAQFYTEKNAEDIENYINSMAIQNIEITIYNNDVIAYTCLKDKQGKSLAGTAMDASIYTMMKNGESYFEEDTIIRGERYLTYCSPIFTDGLYTGAVFVEERRQIISDNVVAVCNLLTIAGFSSFFAFAVIIFFASRIITKPMELIANNLNIMSKGDLTSTQAVKTSLREIRIIAKAQKRLEESLSEILRSLQTESDSLANTQSDFRESFSHMISSMSDINATIEDIAQGATSQAQDTTDLACQTDIMEKMSGSISSEMENLNGAVNIMETSITNVCNMINILQNEIDSAAKQVENVSECAHNTNGTVIEIKNVVTAINDITSQTNLLALNASIEAARAGEAGRGFAVVADNIRTLAGQTAEFANQISDNVEILIQNSSSTVNSMTVMANTSKSQIEAINTTEKSFAELNAEVETVSSVAKEVVKACEELYDSIRKTSNLSQQLSTVSEENAASTQETSATIQYLNEELKLCDKASVDLNRLIGHLKDLSERFVIKKA